LRDTTAGFPYYHMWFLYLIASLYIITPLLQKCVKAFSKRDITLLIVHWFIVMSLIPSIYYISKYGFHTNLVFVFWVMGEGYVWEIVRFAGFYILGVILINQIYSKKTKVALCCILVVSSSLTALIYYWAVSNFGSYSSQLWPGWSFITITTAAVLAFIFLIHINIPIKISMNEKIKKAVLLVSQTTLGIYLVHPIFIDLLRNGTL
jgi:surface polysaccharide O-acyltransferase-like enzyme